MKLMKRSLVLVVVLGSVAMLSAGCAFLGISKSEVNRTVRKILGYPDNPYLKPIPEAPAAYREAFDHLEARRWSQAEAGFREFLKNQPTTNWTLAAQFNIGRSLEEQLRFAEALEKYREVEQKGQTAPKIQGLALVRMGVMVEALGEDAQSLAALKDAERRSAMMSREVALINFFIFFVFNNMIILFRLISHNIKRKYDESFYFYLKPILINLKKRN